jgi:hypothetical protein
MHMIWHDDEGAKGVMSEDSRVVVYGFRDDVGNCRLAKVERTHPSFVQQTIHGNERFSGGERVRWEGAIWR